MKEDSKAIASAVRAAKKLIAGKKKEKEEKKPEMSKAENEEFEA